MAPPCRQAAPRDSLSLAAVGNRLAGAAEEAAALVPAAAPPTLQSEKQQDKKQRHPDEESPADRVQVFNPPTSHVRGSARMRLQWSACVAHSSGLCRMHTC